MSSLVAYDMQYERAGVVLEEIMEEFNMGLLTGAEALERALNWMYDDASMVMYEYTNEEGLADMMQAIGKAQDLEREEEDMLKQMRNESEELSDEEKMFGVFFEFRFSLKDIHRRQFAAEDKCLSFFKDILEFLNVL